MAFGFGCAYLAHYEENGEGARWDNIWISPLMGTGDKYSMAGVIGMLAVCKKITFCVFLYMYLFVCMCF